jgi:hypothetical protein
MGMLWQQLPEQRPYRSLLLGMPWFGKPPSHSTNTWAMHTMAGNPEAQPRCQHSTTHLPLWLVAKPHILQLYLKAKP